MNIQKIKIKKSQLEYDVLHAVHPLFEAFKTETGVSPDYIFINLERLQTIGRPDENIIIGVEVKINI